MEIKEYQVLHIADDHLVDNGLHLNTLSHLLADFPAELGWLVVDPAELPADFSVDVYTIVSGKLAKACAKVMAERKAAAQAAADAAEIEQLKAYLTATDWAVVKCLETGAPLAELYPDVAAKRTQARARINELEPA